MLCEIYALMTMMEEPSSTHHLCSNWNLDVQN